MDDLLVASKSLAALQQTKNAVLSKFKGKDLGPVNRYLNLEIKRDREQKILQLSQASHIEQLLAKYNLSDCKPRGVPLPSGANLEPAGPDDHLLESATPFQELVGALLYLSSTARPDITYAVSVLSRNMSKPTERHWQQAKGVLRYLSDTRHSGITYGTAAALEGWCDADYGGCKATRKSRSGYVYKINGGAVTWTSKLQNVVALSTAESEYIAGCLAAREGVWLKRLCIDLQLQGEELVLNMDNQSAICMANNTANSARTKHIAVAYHYLRSVVNQKLLKITFVPSSKNVADILTKALPAETHVRLRGTLGLQTI